MMQLPFFQPRIDYRLPSAKERMAQGLCALTGCDRPITAEVYYPRKLLLGLCATHFQEWAGQG